MRFIFGELALAIQDIEFGKQPELLLAPKNRHYQTNKEWRYRRHAILFVAYQSGLRELKSRDKILELTGNFFGRNAATIDEWTKARNWPRVAVNRNAFKKAIEEARKAGQCARKMRLKDKDCHHPKSVENMMMSCGKAYKKRL